MTTFAANSEAQPIKETPLAWLSTIIGWAVLASMLVLVIDGAVPQLQMAIGKGYMGESFVRFKSVVLLGGLYFVLTQGLKGLHSRLYLMWFIFLSYAVITVFVQPLYTKFEPLVLLYGFVDNYSLLLFLPLLLAMSNAMNPVHVRRLLFVVFIPLAMLGIAQFITSEPIVPPASADGQFVVNSWTMSGKARAFSLFTSGLRFGYFIALIAAVAAACVFMKKEGIKTRFGLPMLLLALAACASTLTRNVYIMVVEAVFTAYLLTSARPGAKNFAAISPIVYGAMGLLLTIAAPLVAELVAKHSVVLSGDSMNIRLREWERYMTLWLQSDVLNMFFGTGVSQMSRFHQGTVVIDNIYIAAGVHLGIFGLLIFIFLYWQIWIYLIRTLEISSRDPMLIGLVAYWSTAFSSGFFNVSQPTYLAIFVIFILCAPSLPQQRKD